MSQTYKVAALAVIISILVAAGCSNNFVPAASYQQTQTDASIDYFPLEEGYVTTYSTVSSSGSSRIISFEVGGESSIGGTPVKQWIVYSSGRKDTSYFADRTDGLYYYERASSTPEKILAYPIKTGVTWSRYGSTVKTGDESVLDDVITDNKLTVDSSGEDTNNGYIGLKNFPTEGSSTMLVESIGTVELKNGGYYSQSLHVTNNGPAGTRNHYWFAPGVGLVRYVVGAYDAEGNTGSVVGEMLSNYNK